MTFDYYQREAEKTAVYPPACGFQYLALGLCSEAGEVASKLSKQLRDRDGRAMTLEERQAVADEAMDCVWYCSELCRVLGFKLEFIAERNLAKLASRQARGTIQGEGDER